MPKAEKGSIKDLGKKIKAKGLLKLKFYCQLCEKQCRDANGFKCHAQSESHLRQVKLFSSHAQGKMNEYSREFETTFLATLRQRHQTSKVNANNVYQEVIADKQHVHMNSTMWASLTDFCKYLGKQGKCVVEETERGWFLEYIERDAGKMARQEALVKRQQAELKGEQALQERIQTQREQAIQELNPAAMRLVVAEHVQDKLGQSKPIQVALKATKPSSDTKARTINKSVFADNDGDDDEDESNSEDRIPNVPLAPPIQQLETAVRRKRPRSIEAGNETSDTKSKRDTWLQPNILIRIVDKRSEYFKQKAVIRKIYIEEGSSYAKVALQTNDKVTLKLKEKYLETVVPKVVDTTVCMVRGAYKGQHARVVELDRKRYRAVLRLGEGENNILETDYDDFSQLP
jgi:DNA/RNA-binding protein KIN17